MDITASIVLFVLAVIPAAILVTAVGVAFLDWLDTRASDKRRRDQLLSDIDDIRAPLQHLARNHSDIIKAVDYYNAQTSKKKKGTKNDRRNKK